MKLIYKGNEMLLRGIVHVKHKLVPEFSVFRFRTYNYNMPTKYMIELSGNPSEYPEIYDTSKEGKERHYRQLWYNSIKDMPTIEQKLHEMAIQQKKELKKYMLTTVPLTYNGANFNKYITKTHVINNLPKLFVDMNIDAELNDVRDTLCDTLLNYYCHAWVHNKYKNLRDFLVEPNAGSNLLNSFIVQCYKKLALRNEYVLNSTIQQKPRIFSFWWHGGFESEKEELDEKNLCFQFEDYGSFAIRGREPILPIIDMKDDLCSVGEVADYNFHPEVFQIPYELIPKLASIPGYWPGDPYEYPFLLVLTSERFRTLISQLEFCDDINLQEGAAVISSFAWLNAIATYQGFTPFHDITYPLVTHTIITNGQDWNFFVYQLNTIAFHNDVVNKERRNLCWSSGKLRLFETIENGQVKGINEEVFKVLLKFLHNVPQPSKVLDMKPYLGTDTRETDEVHYMKYLLRRYYSRTRGLLDHRDEVPAWVKIYKLHPDAPPSPFIKLE